MKFETVKPDCRGINSAAVERMFDYWDGYDTHVHSCAIIYKGKLVTEKAWKPYSTREPHMLNSMSKTFTSIGIMFAMQEGLLKASDRIVDIFPDVAAQGNVCENMKKMRVEHLLTMSTGHYPDNSDWILTEKNPVSAFIHSDVALEPGTRYVYNTGATFMLSLIIRKLTGKSLFDYLKPRFFDPLEIDAIWEKNENGDSYGGVGLNVSVVDAAKMGLFLLQKGEWNGKKLLDSELIETATSPLIDTADMVGQEWLDELKRQKEWRRNDWECGYGWQIWRCQYEGSFRGDGAFGQYCVVVPDLDLVVAVFSGSHCSQYLLKGIWDVLIPALNEKETFTGEKERSSRPASGIPEPVTAEACSLIGKRFKVQDNKLGITEVSVISPDTFKVSGKHGIHTVKAQNGGWIRNDLGFGRPVFTFPFIMRPFSDIYVSCGWNDSGFDIKVICNGYAFIQDLSLRCEGGSVKFVISQFPGNETYELMCEQM